MKLRVAAPVVAAAVGALAFAAPASAAPQVTEATGANAGAIQTDVTAFEEAVGAADCPADSGCRRIVWDGVPDVRSAPAFMPEGQFRAAAGALFTTPGIGVAVSGDDDSDDAGSPFDDPDLLQFSDIDPGYETAFEPFSAQRLFTSVGSNVIDTRFVVPDSDTAASTNAFGVVFSDVDTEGPTKLEYFEPDGASLGSFDVPATAGDETFSFLGVTFDDGEQIARVRITQGGAALATGVDDVTQGGSADLVTTDNFVFGDPKALGPGGSDGPELRLSGKKKQNLGKAVKVKARCDVACSVEADGKLKVKKGNLKTASAELDADEPETLKLKVKKQALNVAERKLEQDRKVTARVTVTATDGAGDSSEKNRKLTFK
jgi:hypothetical protein